MATNKSVDNTNLQQNAKPKPPASLNHLNFFESLLAGGTAGTIECLIMYPLDVVKTLQQLKVGKGQGTFTILIDLFKREKFGVYRGIVPPLLMEAPKRAIKFTANNTFQPLFKDKKTGQLDQFGAFASGLGAGVSETFVVVPFELVKIRMQSRDNVGKYANSLDAVKKIITQEGPLTFYKGLESTLWRNGVWNTMYFGTLHWMKHRAPVYKDRPVLEQFKNFGIGVLGGTIATTFNTPFDVVKSRIQNMQGGSAPWALPQVGKVAASEGISALYKGYFPKVLRLGPGGGILFMVFEAVSHQIKKRKIEKWEKSQGF